MNAQRIISGEAAPTVDADLFPLALEVTELNTVADGVLEATLAAPDAAPLPAWEPGAHVSFALNGGLVRQYSLCGPHADKATWRIAVLRCADGRGGSDQIHRDWKVGMTIRASLPRNHFTFDNAGFYLFIAGGIGITPLLPMIERARKNRKGWRLIYGGRSLSSMAYHQEMAALGDRVQLWPEDTAGRPDLSTVTANLPATALVYGCGPEGLLKALSDIAVGWPAKRLRIERFSPMAVPEGRQNRPFTAHLQSTGCSVDVGANESLLDALARAGIDRPSGCREGTCGSCETRVLAGEIDHRDSVLSDAEREGGEWMMVCVSRAARDAITLDI